jgi:hypothetical protein
VREQISYQLSQLRRTLSMAVCVLADYAAWAIGASPTIQPDDPLDEEHWALQFPSPGMKITRAELGKDNQPIKGSEVADEITQAKEAGWGKSINTKGLAALGLPAVDLGKSPGNATDFYRGEAEFDGGTVSWRWSRLQREDLPFKWATITCVDKHGARRQWMIKRVVPKERGDPRPRRCALRQVKLGSTIRRGTQDHLRLRDRHGLCASSG